MLRPKFKLIICVLKQEHPDLKLCFHILSKTRAGFSKRLYLPFMCTSVLKDKTTDYGWMANCADFAVVFSTTVTLY